MVVDSNLDLECLNPIFDPALVGITHARKPIVRWSELENMALKNCIRELKTKSNTPTSEELSLMMLACGWRRSGRQIRDRMRKLADVPTAGKVKWTMAERALMVSAVETEKKKNRPIRWYKIREELAASGFHRTSKQIRERYTNLDNPNLNHTPWTAAEDVKLMEIDISLGWSAIQKKYFPTRSQNGIKNRFHIIRQKKPCLPLPEPHFIKYVKCCARSKR